jgi:transposase-like protein
MKIKNHHDVPKLDHRSAPSRSGRAGLGGDSPPAPRARPGDRRHDQLGNFQTALLGRITPASTALSQVIRRTFGAHTPIQRCQIHKARNVTERLPRSLHASVRRALRQAWELDDADKAERLLRNLARRLDQRAPAASILEGIDEMLTVVRLKLPMPLRRSLACTNAIENMMGTVRRVSRNVKRWRNAAMALRWTAAGMMEAIKGFRRLKAHKYLPLLRTALAAHQSKYVTQRVDRNADAA